MHLYTKLFNQKQTETRYKKYTPISLLYQFCDTDMILKPQTITPQPCHLTSSPSCSFLVNIGFEVSKRATMNGARNASEAVPALFGSPYFYMWLQTLDLYCRWTFTECVELCISIMWMMNIFRSVVFCYKDCFLALDLSNSCKAAHTAGSRAVHCLSQPCYKYCREMINHLENEHCS